MKLSDDQLRDLAGDRAFQRGLQYARQGRVAIESRTATSVHAIVAGTEDYDVRLAEEGSEYEWQCSCPAADDGSFCKHLVAVAVAIRESNDAAPLAASADDDRGSDLHNFLREQSADRLASWLMELAESDRSIEKRLRLHQSQSDPKALRKALSSVLRARSFLDWRASNEFARELDPAIQALAAAAVADPAQGIDLHEYALTRLLKIYEQSDDSAGSIGDRAREIAEGYRRCLEHLPAKDAGHGKRFLKLQRLDQWNFFSLPAFWPLLPEPAQRAYASAVESEFAALPARASDGARGQRWSSEFPIVDRMERLAEVRGDIDLLIRIIGRDLNSGYAYQRIVEICREAGRDREAMQWAQRGLRRHPDWRGMRVLLAEQYQRAGLDDEALALLWEDFAAEKVPEAWRRLKSAARGRWQTYREMALAHVEKGERSQPDGRRDVSGRVTLLMSDGDFASACSLAEQHAVSPGLLEHLAHAVSRDRPALAAGFLKRVVVATLPRLDARHYAAAVGQIREVIALHPGKETDAWLTELRARYRAKRKLISLLDEPAPASKSKFKRRTGLLPRSRAE